MKETFLQNWLGRNMALLCVALSVTTVTAQEVGVNDTAAAASEVAVTAVEAEPASHMVTNAPNASAKQKRKLGDVVIFGRNVEIAEDESANDVVVIFGNAVIRGSAHNTVAIAGSVISDGETRDTVAVMGGVTLHTNATVAGDVVAVAGNVNMKPGASVSGDAVVVGGEFTQADGAKVGGDVVGFEGFGWVAEYVQHCILKARPLAPDLAWLWGVVAVIGLLYLLVAALFSRPVAACANEVASHPATTFLIGLLTKFLLAPAVTIILAITGIGAVLIPFLFAALLFAGVLGKVGLLQYIGQQLGRLTGLAALEKPVVGFLLGWVILTLLYLVPVVGFVVMTITSIWALGAAVMAMFGGARKELPRPPVMSSGSAPSSPPANPTIQNLPLSAAVAQSAAASESPTAAPAGAPPVIMSAQSASVSEAELLSLPRAGFWERMGAAFLDVMLVGVVNGLINGGALGFLIALAYFAGMWTWRGTTIGGIVLNLRVVRYDGQPMSFAVALVRSLMSAFSVIVLFLGFLWVAFTEDRQAWHDKIAGTIVVRQPRGMPLLCL